ncbi:hypothetical protein [Galbibacter sp. BG1]
MNDEFDPLCEKCGGTGKCDSGGFQPWGQPIFIECDCVMPTSQPNISTVQQLIADRKRAIRKQERVEKIAQKLKTQQYLEERSAEEALMRSNPNYGRF